MYKINQHGHYQLFCGLSNGVRMGTCSHLSFKPEHKKYWSVLGQWGQIMEVTIRGNCRLEFPCTLSIKWLTFLCFLTPEANSLLSQDKFNSRTMRIRFTSAGHLNMKISSYQYRDPHVKDKTVSRPSYFNMRIPIPGKDHLYIETGPWSLVTFSPISRIQSYSHQGPVSI